MKKELKTLIEKAKKSPYFVKKLAEYYSKNKELSKKEQSALIKFLSENFIRTTFFIDCLSPKNLCEEVWIFESEILRFVFTNFFNKEKEKIKRNKKIYDNLYDTLEQIYNTNNALRIKKLYQEYEKIMNTVLTEGENHDQN